MPHISKQTLADARTGADHLDAQGLPVLASAVRDLAEAVSGRVWAGRDGKAQFLGDEVPVLPITVDRRFREHIQAKVAADPSARDVTAVVVEGLTRFRDGEWIPQGPPPQMSMAERKNINARVPKELVDAVDVLAQELSDREGWKRLRTARRVAVAYLVHRYGMPGEDQPTAG